MAEPAARPPSSAAEAATSETQLDLQRRISQAIAEGHDADVPSSAGYVLDEEGERRRRASIAKQRRDSLARSQSHSLARSQSHSSNTDVEKDAVLVANGAANGIVKEEAEDLEAGTSDDEANVVFWDGPDDPENPYNWPSWRIFLNCFLISFLTFITPLGSSIFAPGVPQLMAEFKNDSTELAAFVVSVYILGFALGPLLFAPLSEIYGRLPVYHLCNIGFVAFMIGCAESPTLPVLIVCRFFSGFFGSAVLTNGGGSIADMVPAERRATAMAAFSIGPLLGPTIGPISGGFLAEAKGWRWVFWLLTIVSGVTSVAMVAFAKESYAPVILARKTKKLQKETGNLLLRSKLDSGLSQKDYFSRSIVRPLRMLLFSPICAVFAVYMAIIYGYLYLLFTSMTYVFESTYGFSTGLVGLAFLGLGIGSLTGLFWYSFSSDRYVKKMAAQDGKGHKPEYRLQVLPYGAVILPVGFFIYGWTAEYKVHWVVPIIGTLFIGIGNLLCFMSISMYLVDAFQLYAASALAANTVVRSIIGAVLPLAGLRMYQALGLGWGNSLLGFIALALVPVPIVILRWGETWRTKYAVKNL